MIILSIMLNVYINQTVGKVRKYGGERKKNMKRRIKDGTIIFIFEI